MRVKFEEDSSKIGLGMKFAKIGRGGTKKISMKILLAQWIAWLSRVQIFHNILRGKKNICLRLLFC